MTALQLTTLHSLDLLVVDAPDAGILDTIVDVRAVLMTEDVPRNALPNARIAMLARPFGSQDLEALVDQLLR